MTNSKYLRSLTEQHPESVAQLFKAHKVSLAPEYRNLSAAYVQAGKPFLDDLNSVFGAFSNYDGDPRKKQGGIIGAIGQTINLIEDRERLRLYEQGRLVNNNNMMAISSPNGGVIWVPREAAGGYTVIGSGYNNQSAYSEEGYRPKQLPDRILGMNKNLFLIIAGVALAVIFLELFQRKH